MKMRATLTPLLAGLFIAGCSDLGNPPVDPRPTLTVVGGIVTEGNHAECLVQLSFVPTRPITFHYATVDETATGGVDFEAVSGVGTIDPADGEDHARLHILTNQNTIVQPPKSFRIVISDVINADVIGDTAQCIILDDDGLPSLSIADASAVEGQAANFTVTINAAASAPVVFTYMTSDGLATAGSDYTAKTGTDTIPAGQTFVIVLVPTTDDGIYESIEDFAFTVSGITGAIAFDSLASGSIQDNDPAPVTFSGDIQPLLTNRCIGCHAGPGAEKGYRIDSYNNVINSGENSPQVIPGNSGGSRLYNVVAWTPGYPRMPQNGQQLSATDIKKIKDWIDHGALDN